MRLMQVRRLQGQELESTQGAAIIILDWRSLVAFLAHGAFALLKNGSIDLESFGASNNQVRYNNTFISFMAGRERDGTRPGRH